MSKYINKKKALLLLLVASAYILIITPLIIINLQKQKELNIKADTLSTSPTPDQTQNQARVAALTCGNVPTDIELIIDVSGSMNTSNKISEAKTAAKKFVDVMARDNRNRLGLVSFSTTATTNLNLTDNFTLLKSKIDELQTTGYTCIECAVKKANQDITTNGRSGIKKAVILLTDGKANYIDGVTGEQPTAIAEQKATDAVNNGYNSSKTNFFTIGFGSDVNKDFLSKIATTTGGKYYFPAPSELDGVYQEISQIIAQGIIGGYVFYDANGNGIFDSNENKQSGWTLQLKSGPNTKTTVTDNTGAFSFTNLCDGDYALKEIPQTGWKQTLPSDPNGYSLSITNGNSMTDKNFGNAIAPTATPTPTNTPTPTPNPTPPTTFLDITLFQHGIGNSGDNTNPNDTNLSNKNPKRQTIEASIEIYNTENQLIGKGSGSVKYNTDKGNYQGSAGIYPNDFPTGKYYLKIKTDYHLRKQILDLVQITAGKQNPIPALTLVTGDSDNNNQLNILDYNRLLDCYGDLVKASTITCNADKNKSTDFNDDSFTNQIDYNLFVREIATQPGQ